MGNGHTNRNRRGNSRSRHGPQRGRDQRPSELRPQVVAQSSAQPASDESPREQPQAPSPQLRPAPEQSRQTLRSEDPQREQAPHPGGPRGHAYMPAAGGQARGYTGQNGASGVTGAKRVNGMNGRNGHLAANGTPSPNGSGGTSAANSYQAPAAASGASSATPPAPAAPGSPSGRVSGAPKPADRRHEPVSRDASDDAGEGEVPATWRADRTPSVENSTRELLRPEVRAGLGALIDSLHELFARDRAVASQAGIRCGICYLHFPKEELEYRDEEGYYVCGNCKEALARERLNMVRRQHR